VGQINLQRAERSERDQRTTYVRHLPDHGAASLLIWRLMFGF
jgi:hypothetical protein